MSAVIVRLLNWKYITITTESSPFFALYYFHGRCQLGRGCHNVETQPLVEDDLPWKTNFIGRRPSVEDYDFRWKMTIHLKTIFIYMQRPRVLLCTIFETQSVQNVTIST